MRYQLAKWCDGRFCVYDTLLGRAAIYDPEIQHKSIEGVHYLNAGGKGSVFSWTNCSRKDVSLLVINGTTDADLAVRKFKQGCEVWINGLFLVCKITRRGNFFADLGYDGVTGYFHRNEGCRYHIVDNPPKIRSVWSA